MANTITGKLISKGETVEVPYSNNTKSIQKRDIVLDSSTYNRFTGEKYENYVQMEMAGDRCSLVDKFSEGDMVTVAFVVDGRRYEKDGEARYFSTLRAYAIEPWQAQQRAAAPANQQAAHAATDTPANQPDMPQGTVYAKEVRVDIPQQAIDDLPF